MESDADSHTIADISRAIEKAETCRLKACKQETREIEATSLLSYGYQILATWRFFLNFTL
jgi:hypothetical protein